MIACPIERIRLDKAAWDEGFGLRRPDAGDWLVYDSLGAPADDGAGGRDTASSPSERSGCRRSADPSRRAYTAPELRHGIAQYCDLMH